MNVCGSLGCDLICKTFANDLAGMVVLKRTWLGLHDQKEENRFVWLDTNTIVSFIAEFP